MNPPHAIRTIAKANGFELGDMCRNCEHRNAWHVRGSDNKNAVPCEHRAEVNKFNSCGCREFAPTDNLEYMEWKYKKIKENI